MLRKYPDQLSWSDVKTLDVSELGWLPRGHHDQTHNLHSASDAPLTDTSTLAAEWLFIDDNISYGSQRVIRELKVYEDWTWSLHIHNRKVSQWNGIPTILSGDKYELLSLFMIAAKSKVCPGFEVCSRRETRSTQGDVIGRTETLLKNINNTEVSSLIHRSTGCQMLLSIQHAEITCKRCATLKKNCGKDLFEGETSTGVSKFKKESIMSEQELKDKLSEERKHRLNAQKREQRLRETVKKEMILFSNNAHEDFVTLFTSAQETGACGNNPDLLLLWDEQKKMLQTKGATGRRWHPKIIRMCLSIWMRSPRAYEELKRSGMLILPSGRLLSMYKNCVDQNPGLNDAVLEWMVREADNTCLPIGGRNGGIVLDEMAIQEDLQIKFTAEGAEVVGLVCLGDENDDMQTIISGEDTTVTATHVLQMVFLGNTGFRFPIAHWPTREVDPATLYTQFWNSVKWLRKGGFHVTFCCLDGGQANRSFVQLHFKGKDPVREKFTTLNLYTHEPMIFYMDPWHNFKKIRNGIEKSSETGRSTRTLQQGNGKILWKYWKDAFRFDQDKHSLPLHHRLTPEHFDLGPASRMRNHLAEEVLNRDMLYLMKEFKKYRECEGAAGTELQDLDAVILLLSNTSKLIANFKDWNPLLSTHDPRLVENDEILEYFRRWERSVYSLSGLSASEKNKMLLSDKARFDISSMLLGLREICSASFSKYPGCGIVAARANSNLVENIFCQQRGKNGQNNNPSYLQYGPGINAICLGQSASTTKCNSGKVEQFSFFKPSTLQGKKRKEREHD